MDARLMEPNWAPRPRTVQYTTPGGNATNGWMKEHLNEILQILYKIQIPNIYFHDSPLQ